MTWPLLYGVLQFWLPIATAFGFLIKAYLSAKKGVTQWADSLINNHAAHIQTAAEEARDAALAVPQAIEKQTAMLVSELKEQTIKLLSAR